VLESHLITIHSDQWFMWVSISYHLSQLPASYIVCELDMIMKRTNGHMYLLVTLLYIIAECTVMDYLKPK